MSNWRRTPRPPRWLSWLPGGVFGLVRAGLKLGILGLAALLLVGLVYWVRVSDFDLARVTAPPATTTLLDRHGKELRGSGAAMQRQVTRAELPPFLIECLEAREDARFYQHHGVDLRGLARATLRNLKDRNFTQGASTLTMQLARNTFDLRAKSLDRKLLEIALTLRIERRYSKDEILTAYLNRIYFGAGCHGIFQAAETYFGKSPARLDEAECAMLTGIIRGPHIFSPSRNLKGARDQQREVLDRLVAMGRLTPSGKQRIFEMPITLVSADKRKGEQSHALQAIHRELNGILDARDIRRDGLIVLTTIDPGWQLRLDAGLDNTLTAAENAAQWPHPTHAAYQPGDPPAYLQCAAVTVESKTGAILALVGGRDFLDSRFDRSGATRRDLGSTFVPWVAAAAAERGQRVMPGNPILTGRQIGPLETGRIAQRCGLPGPFPDSEDLFRGYTAATPLQAATALATLASGGKRPRPYLIQRISDADGRVLYSREPRVFQAISRNAAREGLEGMEGTKSARCLAGRTHSTHDGWLLRVGPSGATAIWFGFDEPTPIAPASTIESMLHKLASQLD